jgi:negative regulator of flagellin synthesis FlgM
MSYANGIGGPQQVPNAVATTAASELQQPASAATTASSSNVQHADQTSLSAAGGLVSQALEGSDVRSSKVASIQQAIAAGTYNVSSSDVADKIIQSLLE